MDFCGRRIIARIEVRRLAHPWSFAGDWHLGQLFWGGWEECHVWFVGKRQICMMANLPYLGGTRGKTKGKGQGKSKDLVHDEVR